MSDEAEGYWQRIWEDVACPNCGASWDLNPDGHPQPGCLCHEPSPEADEREVWAEWHNDPPEASSPSTEPVKVDVEGLRERISADPTSHSTSYITHRELATLLSVYEEREAALAEVGLYGRDIAALVRHHRANAGVEAAFAIEAECPNWREVYQKALAWRDVPGDDLTDEERALRAALPDVEQESPDDAPPVRAFYLERDEDETGISGTGRVAQGFRFDDGRVALRWLSEYRSTAVYDSLADVLLIHGHGGKTRVVPDQEGEPHTARCGVTRFGVEARYYEPDSPDDVGIRRRTTDESLTYLGVKIGELDVRLRRLEVPDQEGE